MVRGWQFDTIKSVCVDLMNQFTGRDPPSVLFPGWFGRYLYRLCKHQKPTHKHVSLVWSIHKCTSVLPLADSGKTEALLENKKVLTSRSPDLDVKARQLISTAVNRLFRPGWAGNQSWYHPRRGTKARFDNREPYQYTTTEGIRDPRIELSRPFLTSVYPTAVPDKGKFRVITIPDRGHDRFKPLQRALWRCLRRRPEFVIDGPLTQEHIDGLIAGKTRCLINGDDLLMFLTDADGVRRLVSVDYTAATDHINLNATYYAMQKILEGIDYPYKKEALAECAWHILCYENGEMAVQTCGQLMGSLLSFPILCVLNYCTTMKVTSFKEWEEQASLFGFVLNEKKTYVHDSFCTMNSLPIWKGKILPFVNLKCTKEWSEELFLKSGTTRKVYIQRVRREDIVQGRKYETRDLHVPRGQGGLGCGVSPVALRTTSARGHYGRLVRHGWTEKISPPSLLKLAGTSALRYIEGVQTWTAPAVPEPDVIEPPSFHRRDVQLCLGVVPPMLLKAC